MSISSTKTRKESINDNFSWLNDAKSVHDYSKKIEFKTADSGWFYNLVFMRTNQKDLSDQKYSFFKSKPSFSKILSVVL